MLIFTFFWLFSSKWPIQASIYLLICLVLSFWINYKSLDDKTFIRTQISWKTVELWSTQFGYTSTKSSWIHQHAYIIIIVLFIALKPGLRGEIFFQIYGLMHILETWGGKRGPNSEIRVTFFRVIGIGEKGRKGGLSSQSSFF